MISIDLVAIGTLVVSAIPSAVLAFLFWNLERKLQKKDDEREKERAERHKQRELIEEKRRENEFLAFQAVNASLTLSEATARAVQRIPDAHCNGDMHEALEYAQKIRKQQRDFLDREGLGALYHTNIKED